MLIQNTYLREKKDSEHRFCIILAKSALLRFETYRLRYQTTEIHPIQILKNYVKKKI
jgi:CHASE2 domain-containing sensor protein